MTKPFHILSVSALICGAVLILAVASPPSRAGEIGRAEIGGRTIIIDDNGTWAYAGDAKPKGSAAKTGKLCDNFDRLVMCVRELGWKDASLGSQFIASYSFEDKFYIGVIREQAGMADGLNKKNLRAAILVNAAQGSGRDIKDIKIFEEKDSGKFNSIMYSAEINGLDIIYFNMFRIFKNESIQIVFWSLGKSPSENFRTAVKAATEKIRF